MRYLKDSKGITLLAGLALLALAACGGSSAVTTQATLPAGAPLQPELDWIMLGDGDGASAWARDAGLTVGTADGIFAGGYMGEIVLAPGTPERTTLTADSLEDAYVARARAADGRLEWVVTVRSEGDGWVVIADVCETPAGIAIVGYFQGPLKFYDQHDVLLEETEAIAVDDGFVAHYSREGEFDWARPIKSPGYAEVLTVTAGVDGSIVVGGLFTDVIKPGCLVGDELVPVGDMDGFLAAYDLTGCHLWAKQFESEKGGFVSVWSLATLVEGAGDLVVTGDFRRTATFEPGYFRTSLDDSVDCFIARLDGFTGAMRWVRSMGGPGEERSMDVAVAERGSRAFLRLAGGFEGTARFGCDCAPVPDEVFLTSAGDHDGFVAAYDGDGMLEWAVAAGGPRTDFYCDVTVRPIDGAVTAVGFFTGTCRFTDSPVVLDSSAPEDQDGMVVGLTADGIAEWATRIGGLGDDCVSGIDDVAGSPGDAYLTGSISGDDILFGPRPVDIVGEFAAFQARFSVP